MKIITIFSEKGGVGKTTLTAMLGSYLAYHLGEKVYAMDFDAPSFHLSQMRRKDLALLENPTNRAFITTACEPSRAYPIAHPQRIRSVYSPQDIAAIVEQLRRQTEGRDGYFLLDFPGRFNAEDPVYHIAASGLLDLMVVPVDTDRQTRASALLLASTLHSDAFRSIGDGYAPDIVALWNRESSKERSGRRDWYTPAEEELRRGGVDVLPVRVRDMIIMRRDADVFGFLRSTMCWPDMNVRRMAPYLGDLFASIKERADSAAENREKRRN